MRLEQIYRIEVNLQRLSGELSFSVERLKKAVKICEPQSDLLEEVLSEVQYIHTRMLRNADKLRMLRKARRKPVQKLNSKSYPTTRLSRKRMYGPRKTSTRALEG